MKNPFNKALSRLKAGGVGGRGLASRPQALERKLVEELLPEPSGLSVQDLVGGAVEGQVLVLAPTSTPPVRLSGRRSVREVEPFDDHAITSLMMEILFEVTK